MLVFMNPTARNVSTIPSWRGIRAPWLGTKNTWRLFHALGFITRRTLTDIEALKPKNWTPRFARRLYDEVAASGVFVTNLAKCVQVDARPLPDSVFREYLPLMYREILLVRPKYIVTFGNQVSSVLLGKRVSVGGYKKAEHETLRIGARAFSVFPAHYPVGQGQRNMPLAVLRLRNMLRN